MAWLKRKNTIRRFAQSADRETLGAGYKDGYRNVPVSDILKLNHSIIYPNFKQTNTEITFK